MVTFIFIVFLMTGDGQAKIFHAQKVNKLEESISMALQINENKQTPYSAACFPLGPSV